jgi:hypothetical protein
MSDKWNGWRPIEEAPKDCTLIMLGAWEEENDFNAPTEHFWVATVGYLQKTPGIIDGFRDYYVYNEFGELMRGSVFFTYWRPMPEPPAPPEEGAW